jgi:hypothetical protein
LISVEDAVNDTENLAALDIDEQRVHTVLDPNIPVGRIGQPVSVVVVEPVLTAPEGDRQHLAIAPALVAPAGRLHVRLPVVTVRRFPIDLIGARIEILVIFLPLRRLMTGLLGAPIVALALLNVLRLLLLRLGLSLLNLLLLGLGLGLRLSLLNLLLWRFLLALPLRG